MSNKPINIIKSHMNGNNQVTFIVGQRRGFKFIHPSRPEGSLFSSVERIFSTDAPESKYEFKTWEITMGITKAWHLCQAQFGEKKCDCEN